MLLTVNTAAMYDEFMKKTTAIISALLLTFASILGVVSPVSALGNCSVAIAPSAELTPGSLYFIDYIISFPAGPAVNNFSARFYDQSDNTSPMLRTTSTNTGAVTVDANHQANFSGADFAGKTVKGYFKVNSPDTSPIGVKISDGQTYNCQTAVSFSEPPVGNQPPIIGRFSTDILDNEAANQAITQTVANGGSTYSASATYSDESSVLTGTVDYGDGTGQQPLEITPTKLRLTHSYATYGDYVVTVHLTDEEGLTRTSTTFAIMSNLNLTPSQYIPVGSTQTINYSVTFPSFQNINSFTAYFMNQAGDNRYIIQNVTVDNEPNLQAAVDPNTGQVNFSGTPLSGKTITGSFVVNSPDNSPVSMFMTDGQYFTSAQRVTFGPPPTYNLSGIVFNDFNRNGVKDALEGGLNNVSVTLDTGATAHTNSSGNYTFTSLPQGTYTATASLPFLYVKTTDNPATVNLTANKTQNFGARFSILGL